MRYGAAVVLWHLMKKDKLPPDDKVQDLRTCLQYFGKRCRLPAKDIIFDPNVLTLATGMDEHNAYGLDFIDAVGK